MKNLTAAEAETMGKTHLYESMSHFERAEFQLQQEFLCFPWPVFCRSIESVLGRRVQIAEMLDTGKLLEECRSKRKFDA